MVGCCGTQRRCASLSSVVREVCPGGGAPFSSLKGVTSWGTVGEGSQDENEKDGSRGIGKVGSVIS